MQKMIPKCDHISLSCAGHWQDGREEECLCREWARKENRNWPFFSMKEGASPTMTSAGNVLETASRVSGLWLSVAPVMNPSEATGGKSDRNKRMDVKNRNQMEYLTERILIRDFIPYPRFLLDTNLTQTARILYALLLDRSKISRNNGWKNEKGYIYVIYPIMDLAQVLVKLS